MGDPVAQMDQGGQQPVDEHQPVPGAGSDRPPARPISQSRVLPRLPARSQLGDQLSQHFPGQPVTQRSATAAARVKLLDTPRTCPGLHEQAVSLTMHEVVDARLSHRSR